MLYNLAAIQEYHDLFKTADLEISIFTGIHDMEYAEEFIKAAHDFLIRPKTKLRIACQCGSDMAQCHILTEIASDPDRQGEILLYDAHMFSGKPYFILTDQSGYRIEIPELKETIQAYGDLTEIDRLQNELHCILSLSPMKTFPPAISQQSPNNQKNKIVPLKLRELTHHH